MAKFVLEVSIATAAGLTALGSTWVVKGLCLGVILLHICLS